ncbi:MAG: molybdopterin molybdotransferase MoeA [Nibricoccus sp.]
MTTDEPVNNASLDEVFRVICSHCKPLPPAHVTLSEAIGRILQEDVLAPEDLPAFDRSAVDGYAVRTDDNSTAFRVVDFIRAGDWHPLELKKGEAVRIATGGALPSAGLQVVMQENARIENDLCTFAHRTAESHVRQRGEDARKGSRLVPTGTRIDAGILALLASIGYTEPKVARKPNLFHFATGNEIVPPGHQPEPGKIRDSNSPLIAAFCRERDVDLTQMHLAEEKELAFEILNAQQSAIETADIVLFSGGASVGRHDYTAEALTRLGFEIRISRTNLRPGRPLIVATRGRQIAFGIPGNPLAHFMLLQTAVRCAINTYAGIPPQPTPHRAILVETMDSGGNTREILWPARVQQVGTSTEIRLLPWASSGDITVLARTNAIAVVPAGTRLLDAGTAVSYFSTQQNP